MYCLTCECVVSEALEGSASKEWEKGAETPRETSNSTATDSVPFSAKPGASAGCAAKSQKPLALLSWSFQSNREMDASTK